MAVLSDILAALRNLVTFWFTVTPWEQALRVRRGRFTQVMPPGMHLRIPFLDLVYKQPIRTRTVDVGMQTLTTLDGHAVTVASNVQYRITDLMKLYETIHSPAETIIDLTASAIADYVTSTSKEECDPQGLREYATECLHLEDYGLEGGMVNVTDFAFVPAVRLIQDERQYRDTYMSMAPADFTGPNV